MGTGIGATPAVVVPHRRTGDHRFFTGMALAIALVVFIGFAPTYYLRGAYDTARVSPLVHAHAVLFTGWILLLLAQTSLIAARRPDLHRRLGMAGAALAAMMLVVGYLTAVAAAREGRLGSANGLPPLMFLAVPLGGLAVFATLLGAGLHQRRRSETHKRLMLLATIAILPAAFARMRFIGGGGLVVAVGGTTLLVLTCMLYDRLTHGRVHRAFLWGGLFLILSMPLRIAVGHTDAWMAVAGWLTGKPLPP